MAANGLVLAAYIAFLLIILLVNLLYFFQVFKYRLPGDASLLALGFHILLIILVLFSGSIFAIF